VPARHVFPGTVRHRSVSPASCALPRFFSWVECMELGRRYSNRVDMQERLCAARQAAPCVTTESEPQSATPAPPRRWRLVDRLGAQTLEDLLEDRRRGMTMAALARRYGISLSSVKRLLRYQ
jgi:hypothetical protein